MGQDTAPPYLYEAPSRRSVAYPYSDFNPKRVSQNAYYTALQAQQEAHERQSRPRRQQGPLINFNQHPDSYLIVQQPRRTDIKALPPSAKKGITVTRWIQFGLRLLQLVGCVGLLVLVICVKGAQDTEAWLMRIPPAWDILITLYAIFHLQRKANGRTPASSSSYHVFALSMDVGLIPFYVYVAMVAQSNYSLDTGANGRWRTFFDANATDAILLSAFLLSIVQGGLHLVSISIDVYLLLMFRKIAQLPPDMNPLEDNLTSRGPGFKAHKYKNSDAPLLDEKKMAHMSNSTLSLSNPARVSTRDSVMSETRGIPFGASRMDMDTAFSPHNPDSARFSRQQYEELSIYQHRDSARNSRADIASHRNSLADIASHRHSRAGSLSPSKKQSFVDTFEIPTSPSVEALTTMSRSVRAGTANRFTSPPPETSIDAALPKSEAHNQQKEGLLNDNWYVMDSDDDNNNNTGDLGDASTIRGRSPPRTHTSTVNSPTDSRPQPFPTAAVPAPLSLHPPTPPLTTSFNPDLLTATTTTTTTPHPPPTHRTTTPAVPPELQHLQATLSRSPTSATQASSVYSTTPSLSNHPAVPSRASTTTSLPKSKHYGDLSAATLGIRGPSPHQPHKRPSPSPSHNSYAASHSPQRSYYGADAGERPKSFYHPPQHQQQQQQQQQAFPPTDSKATRSPSPPKRNPNRVISRSGADVRDSSVLYVNGQGSGGLGGVKRREVSGKVVEEGRGGRVVGW